MADDLFEDRPGLELLGIGLVAGQRCFVQRQGVKDGRFLIIRVFLRELFHRPFVSEPASCLVDLVIVLVVKLDRRQPVALAFGLGTDRLTFFRRLPSILQDRSRQRQDQRVGTVADRDSPVGDGAMRVGRGIGKGLDAVWIDERVHHREAAVEFLLRLRRARGLEVHTAKLLRARRYGDRACQQCKRQSSRMCFHDTPSFRLNTPRDHQPTAVRGVRNRQQITSVN